MQEEDEINTRRSEHNPIKVWRVKQETAELDVLRDRQPWGQPSGYWEAVAVTSLPSSSRFLPPCLLSD